MLAMMMVNDPLNNLELGTVGNVVRGLGLVSGLVNGWVNGWGSHRFCEQVGESGVGFDM